MSQYPAHPLAKVNDAKSDDTSKEPREYPQEPYPSYPNNQDPSYHGTGFNNPIMGYPNHGVPNFPDQPSYPPQMNYPSSHPGYPNQPGYPITQPDYPSQPPPAYPGLQPTYPDQQPAYPDQQPAYPGQQPAYPDQQPAYPGQQPAYPGQPVYPSQEPAYPGQQPAYPGQQPAYPGQQPAYPGHQPAYPGYPGHQPAYPGYPGFPQQQPGFPGLDPRGFVPLNPMDGKSDGDATNPMLSSDGGDGGIDMGNSFSDKKIRHAFVKKVYLILSAQLLCTLGFVAVYIFIDPVKQFVLRNTALCWASYGIFIVTYFMLVCPCCTTVRRKWPWNFICLSLFTLAMSHMTATISCIYQTEIVLIALALTTGVCIAVSIFAIQTKIDFTLCHGVLFVFSIVFLLFGVACLLVYTFLGPNYVAVAFGASFVKTEEKFELCLAIPDQQILQVVYGAIGALLFSLFLLVDTQTIIGGKKRKYQISPEEYIFGALQLYLDIVNLFLMILKVVGSKKN